jgi:hypothetical protein
MYIHILILAEIFCFCLYSISPNELVEVRSKLVQFIERKEMPSTAIINNFFSELVEALRRK